MQKKLAYIPDSRTLLVLLESADISLRQTVRDLKNELLNLHDGREMRLPMETASSDSVPVTHICIDFAKVQFVSRAAMDEYVSLKDTLTPLAAVSETNMSPNISAMLTIVRKTHYGN